MKAVHYLVLILLVSALAACGGNEQDTAMGDHITGEVQRATPVVPTYPATTVDMQLIQASEHVYYVHGKAGIATDNEGFISDAGVVVTEEGVVIFDALGTPSLAWKLVQRIREITDKPIIKVIVSHYHADHIYGLQVFKELGAEIYAPEGANVYIDSPQAKERIEERRFSLSPWVNEHTRIVPPDHILKDGSKMSVGGIDLTISVVGAAHSDGDLTMLVEPDRVLFSGDIIFEGRVAYLGDANTKNWLQILEHMETSKLVALIPGHGPAANEPDKAISQTRRYLAFLRQHMGAAVETLTPFEEVYEQINWDEFKNLPAFNEANRRNAYQVYLSMEAEIVDAE